MSTLSSLIRELITFYVKTNYEKYLSTKNINKIPNDEISTVINELYTNKKDHLKGFIHNSLKELLKEEYESKKSNINLIVTNIFQDDEICIDKLKSEIILHQKSVE